MSIRAVIFKVLVSGEVRGVYCHCDGGLDCVGAILNLAYHDPAKVDQLLALGDLLALGMEVEAGPRLPIYEHVIAYHRDYGEPWHDTRYSSYDELYHKLTATGAFWLIDYVYVMKPDQTGHYQWYVAEHQPNDSGKYQAPRLLREAIAELIEQEQAGENDA